MKNELTVNVYKVLEEKVQNGILLGYRQAFKHTDTPEEGAILDSIESAVMNEICEYFNFPDNYDSSN
jgi:hypothetical protein